MPIQLCTGTINCLSDTGIKSTVSDIELAQPDIPRVSFCSGQFPFWESRLRGLSLESQGKQEAHRESDNAKSWAVGGGGGSPFQSGTCKPPMESTKAETPF